MKKDLFAIVIVIFIVVFICKGTNIQSVEEYYLMHLDDIQEESITESPEIEESHDYGDEEQTYNNDDNFDLTKELLNL
jgi:hypothetical protein